MKLLMLRGQVPRDRPKKEIMWGSIGESNCVWEHLAYYLGDERSEILYWGGRREVNYDQKSTVKWVKSLKHYVPDFVPDIIFARGGFKEYVPILKKFPKAFRIYYGSGARYRPKDKIKYDLVLCDSERQRKKIISIGMNGQLWIKPAIDSLFYPRNDYKKYDVCYVGDARFPFRAKIKGIKLAYSIPKDLTMLHLGWNGKYKPPKNVKVKRITRDKMPEYISRCRVGIVPYRGFYDSAPRCIPEFLACGLPIVVLDEVNFWGKKYLGLRENETHNTVMGFIEKKNNFWKGVRFKVECYHERVHYEPEEIVNYYKKNLSMPVAVKHLKELINDAINK